VYDDEGESSSESATKYVCVERVTSALLSVLNAQPQQQAPIRILDLGVGTGLASKPLFTALKKPEIVGVDLSPKMLGVCRSRGFPFAHLIEADLNTNLEDPILVKGSFDCVMSVGTTEFVQDYKSFFAQVDAFLCPGGHFAATFPSSHSVTYPDMNCIKDVEELRTLAKLHGKLQILQMQEYRGWSVSETEHIEYIQILARKPAKPWAVLDHDGVVMMNQRPELYPQTKAVLSVLHAEGPLFMCSYNERARDILCVTQLLPLFTEVLCGLSGSKATQIAELAKRYGYALADCRFFDDSLPNVAECIKAGIQSVHVDAARGLTLEDLVA
jgi:SAM-dependent methyltransferase